jgi:hypothetical protein
MKRFLILACLMATPVLAQPVYSTWATDTDVAGTITTTNDTVILPISGARWATVKLNVVSAGTATATAQVSVDNGKNYFSAVFAKRVDAVSANPTVQAISATTLSTGNMWEIAIPANATNFRVLCAGTGTTTSIDLIPGQFFVPGAPIAAVMFDTTSAVNTAIDTSTLDLSGWEYVLVSYTTPAGGSGTISQVDDAGTSTTMFTVPASAAAWYPFAVSSPSATQVTALPTTGATGALPLLKRMRFQSAGVAALTSRIRIEVRR